jgi:hypothetical protein
MPSARVEIHILDSCHRFALQRRNHGATLAGRRATCRVRSRLALSGHIHEVSIMSPIALRLTLVAGLAVVSSALAGDLALAQNRTDAWTLGPAYPPGGAYDIVAPGMYVGDYSGPPIFVPGRGIINEPCGLPTSACSNSERGAD